MAFWNNVVKKVGTVGPRHIWIPDCQIRPSVPLDHLEQAARYVANKLPDTIGLAGDFFDMPSLSMYDRGKKSAEGRRYMDDIAAGNRGLELFEKELRKHAPRSYRPHKFVTLGNHEERILRAVEDSANLEGKLSLDDLAFKKYGWKVIPFLKPYVRHSISYCHYYPINSQGKVSASKFGCPSGLAQARRMMCSAVAGHRQGLDVAVVHTPHRTVRGVIAGSFYQHSEAYLTHCGDNYWRGILMFSDVQVDTGEFDICEISLSFLQRRYG